MYNYAKNMIQSIYPNAEITGEQTPTSTGWFEVTLIKKDGTSELIYSKKNGDGAFEEKRAKAFMDKLTSKVKA
jgi:selT/selW/selH-like putative selenoprotein